MLNGEIEMKTTAFLAALAVLTTGLATGSAQAEPGGCLKYGAAGAVGGHVAHHGVLGAMGGCATGMYVRHRHRKAMRAQSAAQDAAQTPVTTPDGTTRTAE